MTTSIREQLDLNSWWAEIVHEAFDDFYPKQEGGSKERSNALAVQGILAIKMIPAIESLISKLQQEAEGKRIKDSLLMLDRIEEVELPPTVAFRIKLERKVLASQSFKLIPPQNKEESTNQPKP